MNKIVNNIEPPKDNLYQQLKSRHHLMVPMLQQHEDKELTLPMVVLTSFEEMTVKAKAHADTAAMFKVVPKVDEPSNWNELMDFHQGCWTIYFATRLPNDLNTKYFLDKDQVANTYTPEELGILSNNYLDVKLSQPHLKHINFNSPTAFQDLMQDIMAAGKADFFLNGHTTHSLKQFIHYLIAELTNSPKDNGSSGTV